MADPYADIASPAPQADPYAGIAVAHDPAPSASAPTAMGKINTGINYLGTQATKAATGFAGTARAISDVAKQAGLPPAMLMTNPITAVGQFMPSTEQMNKTIFGKFGVPEVGSGNKVLDAGVQAAAGAAVSPGSAVRNILPLFVGGAGSEAGRQAAEGTPYEIPAAVVGGLASGIGTAGIQNFAGNLAQGARNVLAPNIPQTTGKLIARGLARDRMTSNEFAQRHADLGPDALAVEAAGPNLRGMVRGSIAAPGEARTVAQEAFDNRLSGSNQRTTAALDKGISPTNSLAATVDDLSTLRAQQASPLYEASGIPRKVEMTETVRPGEPVPKRVPILPGARAKTTVMVPGESVTERSFNSPEFKSPEIDYLLKYSPDVRAAMNAARRLPQFKDVPDNSMIMLDKAYKHLNGMEQEAIRAGNGTRAFDLKNLRQDFQKALTDANPKYQEALDAFSTPSKLMDAGKRGQEWFAKNVDPVIAGREYHAMSPPEQEAALIGLRDWARNQIGKSDRGMAAEKVLNSGNNRERFQAILSEPGYNELAKTIGRERNAITTARDINVGSRTTPMALEAADNADMPNALASAARGKFGTAMAQAFSKAYGRMAEGRTEQVNSEIANALTSTDPSKVGLVASLAEKARRDEFRRNVNRRNALAAGGAGPTMSLGQ